MSSKKRQLTLGAFGFSKKVKHREEETVVKIPESIDVESTAKVKCNHCPQLFKSPQGLSIHVRCHHPEVQKKGPAGPAHCLSFDEEKALDSTVSSVIKDLLDTVEQKLEKEVETDQNEKAILPHSEKKSWRRGQSRRGQYSAIFKSNVIADAERGDSHNELALKYKINRSLVSKWLKDKSKILKAAGGEYKKHLKNRPSRKYNDLYLALKEKFKTAQGKGHRVNFNWLSSKARVLYREMTGDENVVLRKHVIVNFIKRHNICMRSRQRNKNLPKESFRDKLTQWHVTTRERLVRTGKDDSYDTKWGRFQPMQRLNMIQSPLPFACDVKRTYHMFDSDEDSLKCGFHSLAASLSSGSAPSKYAFLQWVSNHNWLSFSEGRENASVMTKRLHGMKMLMFIFRKMVGLTLLFR